MQLAFWALALLILLATNYWAGRTMRSAVRIMVLLATSLPAVALVAYTGLRLSYAIMNQDQVRLDRSYFGADQAFVVSLVLAGVWWSIAYAASRWGRR